MFFLGILYPVLNKFQKFWKNFWGLATRAMTRDKYQKKIFWIFFIDFKWTLYHGTKCKKLNKIVYFFVLVPYRSLSLYFDCSRRFANYKHWFIKYDDEQTDDNDDFDDDNDDDDDNDIELEDCDEDEFSVVEKE